MKIHYFQHASFEEADYILDWAKANNHTLTNTLFFEEVHRIPSVDDIDGLIILGGPMNVYEEEKYPWLKDEKAFIRAVIDAGKPVLGICLGGQLIATVLGSSVKSAPNKEIGWFPVMPTEDAVQVEWFHALMKDNPIVFHLHSDQFEIPEGAVNLAYSTANRNQAYILGDRILGLQFHMEMREEDYDTIYGYVDSELAPGAHIQDKETIKAGFIQYTTALNKFCDTVLTTHFAS